MSSSAVSIEAVPVPLPDGANVIIGQAHFIKTVDDLYETLVESSLALSFGIAFCEASSDRLVRTSGNDDDLLDMAAAAA